MAALLALGVNSFYEEVLHFRPLWLLFGIVAVLGRDAWRVRRASAAPVCPAAPGRLRLVGDPRGQAHGGDVAVGRACVPVRRFRRRPARGQHAATAVQPELGAQGVALASVSMASLLVARTGGPAVVGEYALLRVLPWLFGVVCSCGLPTASAFFLAGAFVRTAGTTHPHADGRGGAGLGLLAWLLARSCSITCSSGDAAVLALFVARAGLTQLLTVTAKGCCQGDGDIAGANLVIIVEELWFVAVYPAVLLVAHKGSAAVLVALIVSGAWLRRPGWPGCGGAGSSPGGVGPRPAVAKKIAGFGARGQLGNMLWLMNLRFDFMLLGALAGPAVLGIYAVASKFAELMRPGPTAMNYVLYPRFASVARPRAVQDARRLLPRATR